MSKIKEKYCFLFFTRKFILLHTKLNRPLVDSQAKEDELNLSSIRILHQKNILTTQVVMGFDWAEILKTAKDAKLQHSHDSDAFLNCVESYFLPCYEQFLEYAEEMSRNKDDSVLNPSSMKKLVLQTRGALKFGLCCHSVQECSQEIVLAIQASAVVGHDWCEPLASILTYRRGDKKCRIFAAQLMSNLVTSNTQTASIVSSRIGVSPSARSISTSILDTVPYKDDVVPSTNLSHTLTPNWVDMILSAAKSDNREALAAIAAALHNCVSSLSMDVNGDESKSQVPNMKFMEKISSNGLLVCTLLRNFISAKAITKAIEIEKSGSDEENDHWDSATDWIQLLLSRLAKLGMLPNMFNSIHETSLEVSSQSLPIRVLPEQNVLLQCMSREASTYVMEYNSDNSIQNPFGGEEGSGNESFIFLAQLIVKIAPWFRQKRLLVEESNQRDQTNLEEFNDQLLHSGFLTITEILATMLGVDSARIASLRLCLGQESSILQEAAKCLGVVLDDLAEHSVGRKAREIKLSEDDQELLISLVQFVGNLCYGCKHNQDLLRTTLVPRFKPLLPRVEEAGEPEDSATADGAELRNGLHVLLTCTTHATACFTLREWGVIAIRNVLENNTENQAVVQNLMAQGPVESADLHEAGMRVQLDSQGKVSLATIDET